MSIVQNDARPGGVGEFDEADGEGGLQIDWLNLLWRFRLLLIAGGLCGLALGIAAYIKFGPEYAAVGQVMVSRRTAVSLKEETSISDFGERSEHIALVMSPMIVNDAIRRGNLKELRTLKGESEPAEELISGLKVKRVAGQDRSFLNVLDISYQSPSASDARKVVQAVIDAYAAYLASTRDEKTAEMVKQAEESLAGLTKDLRAKEAEYLKFRESTPLQWRAPVGAAASDGTTFATNVHQERVIAIEEQRRLNILRQAELRSRQESLEAAIAANEPQATLELLVRRYMTLDGPGTEMAQQQQEVQAFENRLLPLILEEQKLMRDFGKDHPEVQAVRKSINTTLEFYRKHGLRMPDDATPGPDGKPYKKATVNVVPLYIDSLRQQITELKLREGQLTNLFTVESDKAKEYARFQAQDQAMTAEITRLRDVWAQLVSRIDQLKIDKDASGYNLKQIGPIKDQWVLKRLLKFVGMGAVAGFAVAVGLCGLREWRANRIRSVREVRQLLPDPYLGSVRVFNEAEAANDPVRTVHPSLRYLRNPASIEAENYRTIRTSLLVAINLRNCHVLQVGSPEPGDGKTTLISNLAVALASSGKRVILIDADLRRPTVHRIFGLRNDVGLTDVLRGEIDLQTALIDTVLDGLRILPSGHPPGNPAELLEGGWLDRTINAAKAQADIVLIDAPPVLAVTDSCVLGRHVDGFILAVRMAKNRRPMLRQTRDMLRAHGIPLLGVVVNGVEAAEGEQMGYYEEYSSRLSAKDPLATETGRNTSMQRETISS